MNTKEIESILEQFLSQMAKEIQDNLPGVTGKTKDSITVNVKVENDILKGDISGSKYIWTLEDGRPPTRSGAKSSGTSMREGILEWINAKGFSFPMQPKYSWGKVIKDAEGLSWAIAISIHKHGNQLYQRGGKSGVITNVVTDERIDNFVAYLNSKLSRMILNNIVTNNK
jgi:hypothetical protein